MSENKLYQWTRIGPFKTKAFGITVGERASLNRRCAVIDFPDCPVELHKFQMKLDDVEQPSICQGMEFYVYTKAKISGIEFTVLSFDLFNCQVECHRAVSAITLSDYEQTEISVPYEIPGTQLCEEFTYLVYISRVRRQDGAIWKFDASSIASVMAELKLEASTTIAGSLLNVRFG